MSEEDQMDQVELGLCIPISVAAQLGNFLPDLMRHWAKAHSVDLKADEGLGKSIADLCEQLEDMRSSMARAVAEVMKERSESVHNPLHPDPR